MAWLGDVEDCCAQIELEGSLGNVDSWVLLSHEVDVAHRQILQVKYWSLPFFGRHGNCTKDVVLFIALTGIQAPSPLWSSSSSSKSPPSPSTSSSPIWSSSSSSRSPPSPSTSSSPRTRCASCRCTWCRAWWLLMTIQYLISNILRIYYQSGIVPAQAVVEEVVEERRASLFAEPA